jgi:hypothetical protein
VQKVVQATDKDAERTVVVPEIRTGDDTATSDDAAAASAPLLLHGRRNVATDAPMTGRAISPRNSGTGTGRKSGLKYESEPETENDRQADN